MKPLTLDLRHIDQATLKQQESIVSEVIQASKKLRTKQGLGSEFTGWLDLPEVILKNKALSDIKRIATALSKDIDVLLVIGIGGSYLGAKAAIEALSGFFIKRPIQIIFAGHHLSGAYLSELKSYLKNKQFAINVISKSGTTTEPAIAFRIFREMLEDKIGKQGAAKKIVATTDQSKGALFELATKEKYEKLVIPDDVGGRYSVLTPVGLLPLACAGIDIDAFVKGSHQAMHDFNTEDSKAPHIVYAALRNALYRNGKKIEVLVSHEPRLHFLGEWWKQLFGESEGKDGQGLFVSSVQYTTDLHSLGQYMQDGERHLFETFLHIEAPDKDMNIPCDKDDLDRLNYLTDQTINAINQTAMEATLLAHQDGGTPSGIIRLRRLDAYHVGYIMYFFEISCALSGYTLGVNPFDQPGVEDYKKNMFALLGKPGYESLRETLKKRLQKK